MLRASIRSIALIKHKVFSRSIGTRDVKDLAAAYKEFAVKYLNRKPGQYLTQLHNGVNGELLIKSTHFPDCKLPTHLFQNRWDRSASHVLLERCTTADIKREKSTIDFIKEGKTTGVIGYPDEDMSPLLNRVHMTLLDDLFKENGVKCIFARIDETLVRIEKSSKSTDEQKLVSVYAYSRENLSNFKSQLNAVSAYSLQMEVWTKPGDIALLVEFTEQELINDSIDLEGYSDFGMAFFASNRNIGGVIKFMTKAGQFRNFIVDRMTTEQAEKCCEVLYQLEPHTYKWAYDSERNFLSADDARNVINDRIQIVGPNLRHITGSLEDFKLRVFNMKNSVIKALLDIREIGFKSVPESTSMFIGLALRPHVTIPNSAYTYKIAAPEYFKSNPNAHTEREWRQQPCYHFTFVSEYAKELVLNALEQDHDVKSKLHDLEMKNLVNPLREFVVKHALCMKQSNSYVNEHCLVKDWEFVRDPGCNSLLTADMKLKLKEKRQVLNDIKKCTREELYSGNYLKTTVAEMVPGVLYHSSESVAVGQFCFINADKSCITYVKVSCSDPAGQAYSVPNLYKIAKNHHIAHGQEFSETCRLRLLFVTGWNDKVNEGLAVKYTSDGSHNSVSTSDVKDVDVEGNEDPEAKKFGFKDWETLASSRTKTPSAVLNADCEKFEQMTEQELSLYPPKQLDWLSSKIERLIVRARLVPQMPFVSLPKVIKRDVPATAGNNVIKKKSKITKTLNDKDFTVKVSTDRKAKETATVKKSRGRPSMTQ